MRRKRAFHRADEAEERDRRDLRLAVPIEARHIRSRAPSERQQLSDQFLLFLMYKLCTDEI